MKLFFRQAGESGPAIVILHGVFGSADNWLTVGKQIAEKGFRVFMLDQRNHGRSPWSDDFGYQEMAEDLHEFIQDQQLTDPLLIGHSMGGKTVMQFALNYPELLDKMVVVDIAPRFYPVHHTGILKGMNLMPLATLKNRQDAETFFTQYEDHPGTRAFVLKNLARADEGGFTWRLNLPVITREIETVGSELSGIHPVSKPVLFVRGELSSYITEEDEKEIFRIFPQARVETIAGASHWVQADQPEAFIEAVMNFVKE
ncbi:alpha/beta hydrolase [Siphonobacter sp. BAB-5405]|uniref:alpha/beta fold hydrolase n=1 Tax=Siphonobacter sp. BAB-5405 TaxID=1864825 RepID=UPI000C80B346|nr:alpha/beta fold hydrolase [Siphonobacter sp. BAB-5405]PMD97368.1 alpha/beta hydrolase [Siphonobacter sp. BAB-5405]